jgi:hypothetical protein
MHVISIFTLTHSFMLTTNRYKGTYFEKLIGTYCGSFGENTHLSLYNFFQISHFVTPKYVLNTYFMPLRPFHT